MSGTASGQIVAVSTGPNTYQYDIILDDTGTTAIGTLWFAWNASPDYNLMTIAPTSVLAPSGWTALVTNNGTGDGYGIQWTANSATSALIPGSTLRASSSPAPFHPRHCSRPRRLALCRCR